MSPPLFDQLNLLQDAGNAADSFGISLLSIFLIVVSLAVISTIRRRDP